jgi:hypothetical protein
MRAVSSDHRSKINNRQSSIKSAGICLSQGGFDGLGDEDSYGLIQGNVAVFDMKPTNVLMTGSGIPIVVDSRVARQL